MFHNTCRVATSFSHLRFYAFSDIFFNLTLYGMLIVLYECGFFCIFLHLILTIFFGQECEKINNTVTDQS